MKNTMRLILVLTALMVLGMSASAQALKLGHVNMQELIKAMPDMATAQKTLETKRAEIDKEMQSLGEQYQTKVADYQKNAATLSDIIRQSKEQELQELVQRIQKFEEMAGNELQKMQQDLMAPIYDKAMKAIEAVGKAQGFTYIMTADALVYASETSENVLPLVKKQLGIQ